MVGNGEDDACPIQYAWLDGKQVGIDEVEVIKSMVVAVFGGVFFSDLVPVRVGELLVVDFGFECSFEHKPCFSPDYEFTIYPTLFL